MVRGNHRSFHSDTSLFLNPGTVFAIHRGLKRDLLNDWHIRDRDLQSLDELENLFEAIRKASYIFL